MVCLAIPITDIDSENEYGNLINCYSMTKPVLFNDFDDSLCCLKEKSYINRNYPVDSKYEYVKENYMAKVHYKGKVIFYKNTPFQK